MIAMTFDALRTDKRSAVIATATIGLLLAIAPFIVGSTLGNAWLRILDFALLYIMLALGLNIVVGFAGLLDMGYIAFYAVGAYLYALLASPHFGLHLPVWAIIPAGVRASSRAFAPPVSAMVGRPPGRLTTPMSRHQTPWRIPVPSALEQASLAANRLA